MSNLFRQWAERVAHAMGSPWAFLVAALTIVAWGLSGSYFKFSDTWQLVINTGIWRVNLGETGGGDQQEMRRPSAG